MRSLKIGVSVLAGALAIALPSTAAAWAPAASAPIHPGVNTETGGASCTSNFIFTNGGDTYIGQAAHCSGTGEATDTNGCDSGSLPIGTPVTVTGASQPGTLVYNSWLTMQGKGETDPDTCQYNDFALVKLAAADVAKVNPSVPDFGGPTGLRSGTGMTTGTKVLSYGNSILRQGVTAAEPEVRLPGPGDVELGLEPHDLHRHPGHPGRLGVGLLRRLRQGVRRPVDGRDRAAARLQRRRRPRQGGRVRAGQRVLRPDARQRHRALHRRAAAAAIGSRHGRR